MLLHLWRIKNCQETECHLEVLGWVDTGCMWKAVSESWQRWFLVALPPCRAILFYLPFSLLIEIRANVCSAGHIIFPEDTWWTYTAALCLVFQGQHMKPHITYGISLQGLWGKIMAEGGLLASKQPSRLCPRAAEWGQGSSFLKRSDVVYRRHIYYPRSRVTLQFSNIFQQIMMRFSEIVPV